MKSLKMTGSVLKCEYGSEKSSFACLKHLKRIAKMSQFVYESILCSDNNANFNPSSSSPRTMIHFLVGDLINELSPAVSHIRRNINHKKQSACMSINFT